MVGPLVHIQMSSTGSCFNAKSPDVGHDLPLLPPVETMPTKAQTPPGQRNVQTYILNIIYHLNALPRRFFKKYLGFASLDEQRKPKSRRFAVLVVIAVALIVFLSFLISGVIAYWDSGIRPGSNFVKCRVRRRRRRHLL